MAVQQMVLLLLMQASSARSMNGHTEVCNRFVGGGWKMSFVQHQCNAKVELGGCWCVGGCGNMVVKSEVGRQKTSGLKNGWEKGMQQRSWMINETSVLRLMKIAMLLILMMMKKC